MLRTPSVKLIFWPTNPVTEPILIPVTVNASPSTSASFAKIPLAITFTFNKVSSGVEALSAVAVGLSFTELTVITWLAIAVPPFPSDIWYGKVTTPLKSWLGVKVITPVTL